MSLNLTLNDEQMKGMLAESLLRALDETTRAMLIQRALEYLVQPSGDGVYGKRLSPIEAAFREAVQRMARDEATRILSEDGRVPQQIRGLIVEAVEKFTTTNREATVTRIADTIADAFLLHTADFVPVEIRFTSEVSDDAPSV